MNEFEDLNTKIIELRNFLLDEKTVLDNLNKDLLIAQLKSMESYISILSIRIGLNAPKEESTNE